MPDPRLSDLAPTARRLVEEMRRINFGLIENLTIRAGLPAFDPAPRIVRDIKLGRGGAVRTMPADSDFTLKPEVVELFDLLSDLNSGVVRFIEIMDGLPRRLRMDV